MSQLSAGEKRAIEAVKLHGSESAAAAALGIERGTISKSITRAREKGVSIPSDRSGPAQIQSKPLAVQIPKDTISVIAIGDYHDCPGQDKTRMKWIARCVADSSPDMLLQIGDFGDWDSVSKHNPGSVTHNSRPPFQDDIESLEEVFHTYNSILPNGPPKRSTHGNHEHRCERFDEYTPELQGAGFVARRDKLYSDYDWQTTAYGRWLFINGAGFVHTPMTIMGKPFGGRTMNSIANDATYSMVFGHSHRGAFINQSKIGYNNSVQVLNLGTAMPQDYIKPYAQISTTGWTYGIWQLSLRGGQIVGHKFISMNDLERQYGD